MRSRNSYLPLDEVAPDKLIEIHVIYEDDEENPTEVHLVAAENEFKAISKLEKHWKPTGPVAGIKTEICDRYKSVMMGSRIYGVDRG